jgi:hypothetical protein
MKKVTIIIYLMFIAVTLNAQKSIYIRPLTSIKFNNSFYERGRFFNTNSPLDFAGNDYYSLYNYGLHANTSQLNIGLGIGMKLSKVSAFELVVATDNSSIKSAFVHKNSMYPEYTTSLIGSTFLRVSADYHRTLYSKSRIDIRGTVGIGALFPSLNTKNTISSFEITGSNFNALVNETYFNYNRISPVIKIGTGLDFKTKSGKSFCSLDVFWTYNPGRMLQTSRQYNVTVTDNTQNTSTYSHSISSKGSGLSFQLSFPIQVYSFGKNKKM